MQELHPSLPCQLPGSILQVFGIVRCIPKWTSRLSMPIPKADVAQMTSALPSSQAELFTFFSNGSRAPWKQVALIPLDFKVYAMSMVSLRSQQYTMPHISENSSLINSVISFLADDFWSEKRLFNNNRIIHLQLAHNDMHCPLGSCPCQSYNRDTIFF